MAWQRKGSNDGPFPAHVGEFCGNHHPDMRPVVGWGEDLQLAKQRHEQYLSQMRFGKPRSCEAFTSEDGAAQGWVGLYAKESSELISDQVAVPTPPELMEPGFEHLYNLNGVPGLAQVELSVG